MGIFRFILSLLVVGSHVAGLGDTAAGGTAVAGFFTISGFLMARTITENYSGAGGVRRFFLNRGIRLMPPLVAVVLLTAGLLWVRDSRGFENKPGTHYMPVEFPTSMATLIELNPGGYPTFFHPQFHLVPQAWSLIVEGAFYLIAPLAVVLLTRRLASVSGIALVSSAVLMAAAEQQGAEWLRSPIAALWTFLLGMHAYYAARAGVLSSIAARVRRFAGLLLVPIVPMALQHSSFHASMIVAPLLVAGWLLLGQWHVRSGQAIDRFFGNLSYGLFLGHFLAVMSMYWIAEIVYARTGVFGIFGQPDVTEFRLRLFSYLFSIGMAVLIFYGVEHPLEGLRRRVRRRAVNQAHPPAGARAASM